MLMVLNHPPARGKTAFCALRVPRHITQAINWQGMTIIQIARLTTYDRITARA